MPPVGFERTVSISERPQFYALDRAATGTGKLFVCTSQNTGLLHGKEVCIHYKTHR